MRRLASLNSYEHFYSTYLKNILRVRVPGTVGHHEVKQFLKSTLRDSGWTVKEDEFISPTPLGNKKFTNIVATLDDTTDRKLAIAAHYDSKLMTPENDKYFIAATDSAVPCALMLDLARVLGDKYIEKRKTGEIQSLDVSPMLIFLDGEEAFVNWQRNDSIYGARHLAEILEHAPHDNEVHAREAISSLDAMDAFVLLDLIGAKNPQFFDLHDSTTNLYQHLQGIEQRLTEVGKIGAHLRYFPGKPPGPLGVEDDHIPFLERGVPILHLITIPFPSVWHTLQDDEEVLDPQSIEDLRKILHQFVLEYFHFD